MSKLKQALARVIATLNLIQGKQSHKEELMSKVKQAVEKQMTKEGLPREAFAIVG